MSPLTPARTRIRLDCLARHRYCGGRRISAAMRPFPGQLARLKTRRPHQPKSPRVAGARGEGRQAYAVAHGSQGEQRAAMRDGPGRRPVRPSGCPARPDHAGPRHAGVGEAGTLRRCRPRSTTHRPDLAIVAWELVAPVAAPRSPGLRACSPARGSSSSGYGQRRGGPPWTAGADGFISMVDAPDVVGRRILMPDHVRRARPDRLHDTAPLRPRRRRERRTQPGGLS